MERSNEGDDTDTSRDEEHWNHDDAKPSNVKTNEAKMDLRSSLRGPKSLPNTGFADCLDTDWEHEEQSIRPGNIHGQGYLGCPQRYGAQ